MYMKIEKPELNYDESFLSYIHRLKKIYAVNDREMNKILRRVSISNVMSEGMIDVVNRLNLEYEVDLDYKWVLFNKINVNNRMLLIELVKSGIPDILPGCNYGVGEITLEDLLKPVEDLEYSKNDSGFYSSKLRVCTECLKEENYIRLSWHDVMLLYCPEHEKFFIDRCPNCNNILSYDILEDGLCSCGYALKDYEAESIDWRLNHLQKYLFEFIRVKGGVSNSYIHLLKLNARSSCERFANLLPIEGKTLGYFTKEGIEEIHSFLDVRHTIIFENYVKEIEIEQFNILKGDYSKVNRLFSNEMAYLFREIVLYNNYFQYSILNSMFIEDLQFVADKWYQCLSKAISKVDIKEFMYQKMRESIEIDESIITLPISQSFVYESLCNEGIEKFSVYYLELCKLSYKMIAEGEFLSHYGNMKMQRYIDLRAFLMEISSITGELIFDKIESLATSMKHLYFCMFDSNSVQIYLSRWVLDEYMNSSI